MAKRKKPSVFNEENEGEDNEDGFMNYVREKAGQSRKRAKEISTNVKIAEDGLHDGESSSSVVPDEVESSSSKYINQLLESKKRRELDRLHAQSVKMKLERKLENSEDAEEIITEGYRKKKAIYEKADELAQDEQTKEIIDHQASILGAEGVALKMVATKTAPDNYQQPLEFPEDPSKPAQKHFGNDVYVNKSVRSTPMWGKQDDLDPSQKLECVKKFLKSNKTKKDIDSLVQQYLERHNGIKMID